MARHIAWVFAAALGCASPTWAGALECERQQQPVTGQKPDHDQHPPGPPDSHTRQEERRWMWWKVAETRTELGISDQQSKDIDLIFQATVPSLRTAKDELDKLDEAVTLALKAGTSDVAVVMRQVQQAEDARAKLTTTRTVMFYRMHRLLTPEQRKKLNAMFEQMDAERRKSGDQKGRR